MGVEAFGVSMRFMQADARGGIKKLLASYPQINIAETGADSTRGEYNDGAHVIEVQSRETEQRDFTLAIRFSLCSYDSIDSVFIDLIKNILSSFEAEVWLMTSAIKQKNNYLPGDSKWLLAALPDEISEMRHYWQNLFGTKQGVVRVKDSFSFVGAVK
jgi:hypothetical protein